MRKTLFIAFSLLFSLATVAQDEMSSALVYVGEADEMPDTIKCYNPFVVKIKKLEELGQIEVLDTLHMPEGFIVRKEYDSIFIVVKRSRGYEYWNITDNSSFMNFYIDAPADTKRVNFDNKGSAELLVGFYTGSGGAGWSENSGGLMLWDLDNARLLFYMQTYFHREWWDTHAFYDGECFSLLEEWDSAFVGLYEQLVPPDDAESHTEHQVFEIKADNKLLKIDETNVEPDDDNEDNARAETQKPQSSLRHYMYEYKGNYLLLKK